MLRRDVVIIRIVGGRVGFHSAYKGVHRALRHGVGSAGVGAVSMAARSPDPE